MLRQRHRWLPGRALVVVADGSYAVLEFLANVVRLPHLTVVTRMRLDAALDDPAPQREAGKKGRPAIKGKRQPTLAQRLIDQKTVWQTSSVSCYGGITRSVELAPGTALWYHAGIPPVPIRLRAHS
jgi:DDE superfamily endonuclease